MSKALFGLLLGLLWTGAAWAQAVPAAEPFAKDLHEDLIPLAVTVKDLYGRQETRTITLTSYRPDGPGPYPLVIMNHGRATQDKRALQGRQRYEPLARYLVSKGFAVIVPTRVGYGDSVGPFDPETTGDCRALQPQAAAQAASDQVLATLAHARTLAWIDTSRWVVMGQSMGGFTVMAVASRRPPGLVAAVNFAGGAAGNPDSRSGNPCGPQVLAGLWKAQAAESRVPMLWLYWLNDRYWGEEIPRTWAAAWREGGAPLEFHQLPAAGSDGHNGLIADMDHWVPLVEDFLSRAGFGRSGLVARPPASDFAKVDEADKLPSTDAVREGLYRRFLAARPPRAFAVGPQGAAGYASGDWALGKALGYCQSRRGLPCKLYAVDDDVVWAP
jgi:dienelactone hydrolase